MKKLVEKNKEEYPLAAEAANRDMMVDDILSGSEDPDTLVEKYKQLVEMFSQIDMAIYKYGTNCPKLREIIPKEKFAAQVTLTETDTNLLDKVDLGVPTLRCLGLIYNPDSDSLQFLA